MSSVFGRVAALFVEPVARDGRPVALRAPARDRAARSVAVLAPSRRARPLGAGLALAAAGRGVAVLCAWRADGGGMTVPAAMGARRLTASMAARGLEARATGRLVVVTLPLEEAAAVAAAERADAAAGDVPVVLAVGGARGDAWDPALRARDAVLVSADDDAVCALAVERLRQAGVPAAALGRSAGVAPALASAGIALPGMLRGLRTETVA